MRSFIVFLFSVFLATCSACPQKDIESNAPQLPETSISADTNPSAPLATPAGSVKILEIKSNPQKYLNREVTVTGNFLGWTGKIGPPPVTRSDWVIEDDTGAIYVNGSYPPGCMPPNTGIGKVITIKAIVMSTSSGQVYLKK